MFAIAAATVLILIAAAHSILGERELLQPLFARDWDIQMPRWAVERVFRFAWHLTSVAWVGLATTLLGIPTVDALGLVCLLSGLIIFFALRGHLAWPLFFFTAAAAWASIDALHISIVNTVVVLAAAVAGIACLLHLYWAFGGRRGLASALPKGPNGEPIFMPGFWACAMVAVACLALASLLLWPLYSPPPAWSMGMLGIAAVLLSLRTIGDGRQVGFTKQNRTTAFARADDSIYTPLFTLLLFGALGALYLNGIR